MSLDAGSSARLQNDLTLAALPAAARWARSHARDVLADWGLAMVTETVELLVSELVTNAVRATGTADADLAMEQDFGRHLQPVPPETEQRVRMRLSYARVRLRIEVWDGDENPPVPGVTGIADAEAEGGRGLMLVESLSLDWGWFPSQRGGKVVWCEVGAVRLRSAT